MLKGGGQKGCSDDSDLSEGPPCQALRLRGGGLRRRRSRRAAQKERLGTGRSTLHAQTRAMGKGPSEGKTQKEATRKERSGLIDRGAAPLSTQGGRSERSV